MMNTAYITNAKAGQEWPEYEQLEDFFENCPVGLHIVASDGTILRANRAELDLLGYTADEYIGSNVSNYHVDRNVVRDLLDLLARGERIDRFVARLRARDGSIKHVQITSNALIENGRFLSSRCLTVDVTATKLAEQRIQEREHRLRQLLDALPAAIYTTDSAGRITYYNQAAADLAGEYPKLNHDEWGTWRLYWPDGTPLTRDQCPMAITLRENRPVTGVEVLAERPDGTRVPVLPYPAPLRDHAGNAIGAVNMLVDISEKKKAAKAREALVGELNHRVKNSLATVQAIAQQSLRHARDPDQFAVSFSGRIQALARAHTLLSANSWKGVEVDALIRDQLLSGGTSSRVHFSGPSLKLEPHIALHLALAIHELGSNARKFGALSVPDGRLSIVWLLESNGGRTLRLSWSETGCPAVPTPTHRGFGRTFISQIAKASGCDARLTCGADGIRWKIRIALPSEPDCDDPAMPDDVAPTTQQEPQEHADLLKGKRILIIEDEPLIALELSQMLADAGLEVAGIARTVHQAQDAVSKLAYSAVVLDANLGGHKVDDLADTLHRRNVPFAFLSGYGRESLPPAFQSKLLVSKPFTPRQVLDALATVVSQAEANARSPQPADV